MTDRFDLSRRKLLGAVGTIGGAAALGGAGTMAFFSDTEEFANNQLTAGELDMKVAYSAHYSDWSPDEDGSDTSGDTTDDVDVVMWSGAPETTGTAGDLPTVDGMQYTGLPANDAWLIAVDDPDQFLDNTETGAEGTADCSDGATDVDDLTTSPVIELGDVKPGDFGEVTFDFALCDNPGYVWLQGRPVAAAENGNSEPEEKDSDETGANDESYNLNDGDTVQDILDSDIELLDEIRAAAWIDDGNNYQNDEESPAIFGTFRQVLIELASGKGFPLAGDTAAPDGGGTGRNCFAGDGATHHVAFAWWLPVDHANEIQTDSVTFDLGFYTEQCRHNAGLRDSGDLSLTAESFQGQGAGFANPWDVSTSLAHTGSGSWGTIDRSGQGISSYKQGFYFGGLFDNNNVLPEYTVSEIDEISYWLYEPTALEGVDIYLNIYTQAENDGDDAAWYDSRLQALPSRANQGSPNFTPGQWNEFSTSSSASNTLGWSDTGRGGNFVLPLPTLDEIQSGPVDWNSYGANLTTTHDYRDEKVLALSLQTGSVSGVDLEAYIDDVTVTLTSGETLNLDLEP